MNKQNCANVTLFIWSLVALTLSSVATAIPYWEYVKLDGIESYYGLWKICQSYRMAEICHHLETVTSSLMLVRTLEMVGVILLAASLLCRIVAQYGMRHRQIVFIWDGLLAFLSGLLMVTGAFVFGCDTQNELGLYSDVYDLHISFVLCVVAGIVAIGAGILRILVERKRRFSLHDNRTAQNQPSLMPVVCSGAPQIILVPLSQQSALNAQGFIGKAATPAVYPTIQGSGVNDNLATISSSLQPCRGSNPTSTPDSGVNHNPATVRASTSQPSPGSITPSIEEPSSTPSLPLCNQRIVSGAGSTEEIWKHLNLITS